MQLPIVISIATVSAWFVLLRDKIITEISCAWSIPNCQRQMTTLTAGDKSIFSLIVFVILVVGLVMPTVGKNHI